MCRTPAGSRERGGARERGWGEWSGAEGGRIRWSGRTAARREDGSCKNKPTVYPQYPGTYRGNHVNVVSRGYPAAAPPWLGVRLVERDNHRRLGSSSRPPPRHCHSSRGPSATRTTDRVDVPGTEPVTARRRAFSSISVVDGRIRAVRSLFPAILPIFWGFFWIRPFSPRVSEY